MKSFILSGLILLCALNGYSQKKGKANFSIEFGLPLVGISPTTGATNPIIQGNEEWSTNMGFSGGISAEYIGSRKKKNGKVMPGFGIKTKALYNYYEFGNQQFLDDEVLKISGVSIPVLLKFCIGSGEVDVKSSQDPDKYSARRINDREIEVTRHPGQFNPGYRTTRSFFLYFGPQYSSFNEITYDSDNSGYKSGYKAVEKNIKKNELAYVLGMEIWLGRIYLDLSYQKSSSSIYTGGSVYLQGFMGRFGIAF
jgi:hypothetical protein